MIVILTLIGGLLIGFFIGLWACDIGIGDIDAYNHKCRTQWEAANEGEKGEVENEKR